jgi:hypothetical protein
MRILIAFPPHCQPGGKKGTDKRELLYKAEYTDRCLGRDRYLWCHALLPGEVAPGYFVQTGDESALLQAHAPIEAILIPEATSRYKNAVKNQTDM